MDTIADLVGGALARPVTGARRLSGGDVAQSFRLTLGDGTTVFAKTHPGAHAEFFETEAIGLQWLRDTDAVPIPEVLHVGLDPPVLVLEWIEPGHPAPTTERELGRALAKLHSTIAPCFGRGDRRSTGSRGLPNEPSETWADFYSENRLLPLARMAHDQNALPRETIADLEAIAARLEVLGGPAEPPSTLHGDLWAGNRMVGAGGTSWLIDPAAHGGHREFDLAMMRLFGGFGAECFGAYEETTPLAHGWRERVELHQLAPLAVHAIKFGGGYIDATASAAARYR